MKIAEKFNSAVILIQHLRKNSNDKAIYRSLGSVDFLAAARSVLMVGADPDDPDTRVVCHAKSSLAAAGPSMSFTLDNGIFEWAGVSALTAEDISAFRPSKVTALDRAVEFLSEKLWDDFRPQKEVVNEGIAAGHSEKTLQRAKTKAGIISRKFEMRGPSFWGVSQRWPKGRFS